jgi:hypothetical protein
MFSQKNLRVLQEVLHGGLRRNQCGGSRSLWIRIDMALLDLDPYCECISDPGATKLDQNLQTNLSSSFCTYVGMFSNLLPTLIIFFT